MHSANSVVIHPSAEVSPQACVGAGTRIWHEAQIREHVRLGRHCIVGKGVYIDFGVQIGDNVKIQNGAYLYHGVTVEDGVFIGPRACFTNDVFPRAITPDGQLKGNADWAVGPIRICYGASIGAGAIVLPNLTIGRFALVAAGAVVTRSVGEHMLVAGIPARPIGWACQCGQRLQPDPPVWRCPVCQWTYQPTTVDA